MNNNNSIINSLNLAATATIAAGGIGREGREETEKNNCNTIVRDNVTVTLSLRNKINNNNDNLINNNNNKINNKNKVSVTVTLSCMLLLHYLFPLLF